MAIWIENNSQWRQSVQLCTFISFFLNRRLSSVHTLDFPERNMEKSIIALLNLDNYGEVTRLLFLPQARNKCLSLIRLPFVESRKHMISTLAIG